MRRCLIAHCTVRAVGADRLTSVPSLALTALWISSRLQRLVTTVKPQRLSMPACCSLELIHKAVRARLGTLVSLSAPTALTVQWALKHRLNLIHVPHRNAPRIYSPA